MRKTYKVLMIIKRVIEKTNLGTLNFYPINKGSRFLILKNKGLLCPTIQLIS